MQSSIAVVQFAIQQFAPEANLLKAEQYVKQVAKSAQLIVFPEDFVTGPINSDHSFADHTGRYVQHFQRLAATYGIDIVPGSIIEAEHDKLYNTTYYIDKTGAIRGRYRKVHLWLSERSYLTPGDAFPVFDSDYGKVGLLICWDLIFPEAFRALVRQGVELVICPAYWCSEDAGVGLKYDANAEVKLVDALCVGRAFENEIVLVFANAAIPPVKTADGLIGRSQITVPFQGALQKLKHNQEGIFMQTVDTAVLGDAELAYRIRSDICSGLTSR